MTNIEHHAAICKDLTALYEKKNHDYGDSFHKSFEEYGMTMVCIRLEDKLNRLKALSVDQRLKQICGENFDPWEVRYGEKGG